MPLSAGDTEAVNSLIETAIKLHLAQYHQTPRIDPTGNWYWVNKEEYEKTVEKSKMFDKLVDTFLMTYVPKR